MSIARNFRFGPNERMNLQLRAEFTNIFNRMFRPDPTVAGKFVAPDPQNQTVTGLTGFGSMDMTSAVSRNNVRQGQLVMRLTF